MNRIETLAEEWLKEYIGRHPLEEGFVAGYKAGVKDSMAEAADEALLQKKQRCEKEASVAFRIFDNIRKLELG